MPFQAPWLAGHRDLSFLLLTSSKSASRFSRTGPIQSAHFCHVSFLPNSCTYISDRESPSAIRNGPIAAVVHLTRGKHSTGPDRANQQVASSWSACHVISYLQIHGSGPSLQGDHQRRGGSCESSTWALTRLPGCAPPPARKSETPSLSLRVYGGASCQLSF